MSGYRKRFWFESAICGVAVVATVLTIASPDWIEAATGLSPDGGNGSLEIAIAFAFAVLAITFACVAYVERRALQRGLTN